MVAVAVLNFALLLASYLVFEIAFFLLVQVNVLLFEGFYLD